MPRNFSDIIIGHFPLRPVRQGKVAIELNGLESGRSTRTVTLGHDEKHFEIEGSKQMTSTQRHWRSLLTITIALTCAVHSIRADERVSLAGDYGEPHIIIPAPEEKALAHVAWPKVVCTADGTLIVAAIAGEFHGLHGGGCPVVSYSTDRGKSFSSPQVLKRYSRQTEYTSAGNCALGIAEDGSVNLLSMAFRGDEAGTIDGWRSTDSGRNWIPTDVSRLDHNQTGSVYGNVIQVPGKGLAVFGHYRKPARSENGGLWISWSIDDGKSWQEPRSVELHSNLRFTEPAVTFTSSRFVGLIRCNQDFYTEITSADHGITWQKMSPDMKSDYTGPHMLPSPCLIRDPVNPDRLLALVSERHGNKGSSGLKGRIVLWEANALELNWKKLGQVARFPDSLGPSADITYAWLAPLGQNRWYVVFYSGVTHGASDIYGLELQP